MKRIFLNLSVVLGATLFALLLGEGALRLLGYQPWQYTVVDGEPTMHQPHPVLGWQNRPGTYDLPPYHPEGDSVHITFLPDASRRTSPHAQADSTAIWLLGGSFAQGWAISDDATFAWGLSDTLNANVKNYGSGGYSTYQSLLRLRLLLADSTATPPAAVVYAFIEDHENRNVAPAMWLEALARYARRGHAALPYADTTPDGTLLEYPPTAYPAWPLREHLVTVHLAHKVVTRAFSRGRESRKQATTEAILRTMHAEAQAAGLPFVFVLLWGDDARLGHYAAWSNQTGIPLLDCRQDLPDELRVKGEAHPNATAHAYWTKCIAGGLQMNGIAQ